MLRIPAIAALVLACLLALHAEALAEDARMVIWYPGEAGSTAEAQPVLDAFFGYLSKDMAPEKVTGQYFNSVKGGLDYISHKKPKAGIISYAAWMQNRAKMGGAEVILSTLPLPGGRKTERYALVGGDDKLAPDAKIYSSEPLSQGFIRQHLFANIPASAKLAQTDRMFVKLKALSSGSEKAYAILTPLEASTLKRIKSDWSKSLKVIERSKPVPTARVVVFDPGWEGKGKFSEALLGAGKDPEAEEILEELRLKGFGSTN